MKKILLSCACCLLAVGLLAGCDNEEEVVTPDEPDTTVPSTGGDDGGSGSGGSGSGSGGESFYVLGVEVGSALHYITGETPSGYAYEGTLTTDISKAVPVAYEQGSDNEYYVSFELEEVPYWVTIVEVEGTDSDNNPTTHVNLSYATEKSALYLHTTDVGAEYLGNEDGSYFLCYYSRFSCLYASAISYLETSPVAGIYSSDGTLLLGGKSPVTAPAIEPVLGTIEEGNYFLGFTMSEVTYYFNGEVVSSYYGGVTSLGYEAVVITIAEVTDGYTLSFTDEEEATQYLNMTESDTNRNLKWGEDPFTWSYDTTYKTFVAKDSSDVWQFIGTYGTNTRLSLSDYGYLTGDKSTSNVQYPAQLYSVIDYVAPTAITVTAEGETSVELGQSVSLIATITGDENVDPRVIWSSNEEGVAAVDSSGLVRGLGTGEATITATSARDSSVTGSVTITVTSRGTATYQDSETIVPGDYYSYVTDSSLNLDGTTTYGSLVDITYAQNSGSTKPQYYVNGANIRVYAKNTITFTPVDETIAKISSIVLTYDSSHKGNENNATFKDAATGAIYGTIDYSTSDALTLTIEASGAVTYTNDWTDNSGGTQLRITQIVINYAVPTPA